MASKLCVLLLGGVAVFATEHPHASRFGKWRSGSDTVNEPIGKRASGFIGFSNAFSGLGAGLGLSSSSNSYPSGSGSGSGSWSGYTGGMSSTEQNGNSDWGSYNRSSLPYYAASGNTGYSSSGYPWGSISTSNSDPYTSAPQTGQSAYNPLELA